MDLSDQFFPPSPLPPSAIATFERLRLASGKQEALLGTSDDEPLLLGPGQQLDLPLRIWWPSELRWPTAPLL